MKKKILLLAMGFALSTQLIMAQVPSYLPTNGLVGYYPFSGNANDFSGNFNNGIVNGASLTSDRFGNVNSAYDFNGVSDFIEVLHSTSLNFGTQDFSMSVWIKPNEFLNTTQFIINKGRTTAPDGHQFRLAIAKTFNQSDGHVYFYSNTGSDGLTFSTVNGYFLQTNSIAALNTWSYMTIVRTGITFKLYLNGQLIAIDNSTTGVVHDYTTNTNNFDIGATSQATGNGKIQFFKGLIDDLCFWNRALTQEEITNLYYAENTCQSLVINTGVLGFNPLNYNNTITIYPNPANDHITIDCGNLANVLGWNIKIYNTLGQEVFSGAMNQQQYTIPLNTWGGQGIYFVKIYDASNNLMNTKKIILQ